MHDGLQRQGQMLSSVLSSSSLIAEIVVSDPRIAYDDKVISFVQETSVRAMN